MSNDPKVLVEFSPEEISWLADRLNEMRGQWLKAELLGASADPDHNNEKINKVREQITKHKKMEAVLRNRLLDKADDQGFGNL